MNNQGEKKEANLDSTKNKGSLFRTLKGKFFVPKSETVLNRKAVINEYDEAKNGKETNNGDLSQNNAVDEKNNEKKQDSKGIVHPQDKGSPSFREKFKLSKIKNFSSKWQAPKILETNLIKNEVTTFIDWSKNSTVLGAAVGIALIIISLAYGGLIIYENSKEKQILLLDEEIQGVKDDIGTEEKKVEVGLGFQRKIKAVEYLLDNHIYWTNFFKFIEDNTFEEVSYPAFSGDTSGKYSLTTNAKIGHYVAVEQVNKFLENKLVKSAESFSSSIVETAEEGAVVNFSLELEVNPSIFKKANSIDDAIEK